MPRLNWLRPGVDLEALLSSYARLFRGELPDPAHYIASRLARIEACPPRVILNQVGDAMPMEPVVAPDLGHRAPSTRAGAFDHLSAKFDHGRPALRGSQWWYPSGARARSGPGFFLPDQRLFLDTRNGSRYHSVVATVMRIVADAWDEPSAQIFAEVAASADPDVLPLLCLDILHVVEERTIQRLEACRGLL
jgi:hypothetical protein